MTTRDTTLAREAIHTTCGRLVLREQIAGRTEHMYTLFEPEEATRRYPLVIGTQTNGLAGPEPIRWGRLPHIFTCCEDPCSHARIEDQLAQELAVTRTIVDTCPELQGDGIHDGIYKGPGWVRLSGDVGERQALLRARWAVPADVRRRVRSAALELRRTPHSVEAIEAAIYYKVAFAQGLAWSWTPLGYHLLAEVAP